MAVAVAIIGKIATLGVAGAFGLTGFVATIANFGASLLLSAAGQAYAQRGQANNSRTVSITQPIAPREIVYGRVRKGGTIVFKGSSAEGNRFGEQLYHLVIVLAAHEVAGIDEIYLNNELAFNAEGIPQGRYYDRAAVEKRLGTDDQTAFIAPGWTEKWTADHRLAGCAAIAIRFFYDTDTYPQGVPKVTAIVRGKNDILDPRTGERGYTTNAALCLADYMANEEFGLGAGIGDPQGIDGDYLVGEANICDEEIALADGGTEPRYTINGVVDTSATPQAIIQAMETAIAGQVVRSGGVWRILSGAYRTPEHSLSDDDAAGPLKLVTRLSRASSFNAVRGTFISPENDWQPDDFPVYASDVYLAEDNGRRAWRDITLPFTISSSAAQRIAKIELEMSRRQLSVEWPAHLTHLRVRPGDTVSLTRARWGANAKPFATTGLTLQPVADGIGLMPVLRLSETSPLVYSWDATEEQIYAAAPRTTLPSAFDVAAPGITNVVETLYATRAGDGVKARATITWSPSSHNGILRYELEGSLAGGDWVRLTDTASTTAVIEDITPGPWAFRVAAISKLGVRSPWAIYEQEIHGLLQPPQALQDVSIQSAGGLAVLKWRVPVDLDVLIGGRVVIRHSSSASPQWTNSVLVDEVTGNTTIAVVPLLPGTYLVRAIDSTGIPGPVSQVETDAAQAVAFSTAGLLQADSAFSGTHDGTAVDAGELTLAGTTLFDDIPGFIDDVQSWDLPFGITLSGIYTFATTLDLGAAKTVRARAVVTMESIALNDIFDSRTGPIDGWGDFDGTENAECDAEVQLRTTPDDPSGSPSWSAWRRINATEITARGVQARALLSTKTIDYAPIVTVLRVTFDEVA
ncbi:phage tail protein [Pararhodobacter zhoushanensis]|uniref:phage tail protein n=1 Tax=Pararhodobacter zhoushanensis TaxID=2479545 RepID=UPI000F8F28B0|nr:phage tail protein [Pararhodobacter zhoushanensis]